MLVISGADLVGKSTFARKCTELLQAHGHSHMLHHLSRPPEHWDYCGNYVERMSVNSVWDRFHLDSLAYRQHDDHPCCMTPLRWDLVEANFRLHCGFQVVLWAHEDDIRERFKKRGDPMYSLEHILAVNDSFLAFCTAESKLFVVRDQPYVVRVDACGTVLDHCIIERTVDAYEDRLREFTGIDL